MGGSVIQSYYGEMELQIGDDWELMGQVAWGDEQPETLPQTKWWVRTGLNGTHNAMYTAHTETHTYHTQVLHMGLEVGLKDWLQMDESSACQDSRQTFNELWEDDDKGYKHH